MRNFILQVIMTVLVRVDDLDYTEFHYWFGIPEDVSGYHNALKEKVKLPIAEIKSEIWEKMFCEMSDRSEFVNSEILKSFVNQLIRFVLQQWKLIWNLWHIKEFLGKNYCRKTLILEVGRPNCITSSKKHLPN